MAPPGSKVLLLECLEYCSSRSPHALSGWYTVPSLENYCCHQICIPAPNSVRIGKTVSWFPHKLIMTTATVTNTIIAISKDLTAALKQTNKNTLLPPSDTITQKALFQIDSIFFNVSSALISQQSPIFKFPMLSTPKPVDAPLRVSQSTTQDFHNISPTT